MRINYSDDEDRPGQFALWDANVKRSVRSKRGQQELRELETALLALPDKRLVHGRLVTDDGDVCAIGCYAKHKGLDLSKFDSEDESDEVGIAAGMPRLVAWKVVALNDIEIDDYYVTCEGPTVPYSLHAYYHGGGYSERRRYTPEQRYEKVLAWVQEQLRSGKSS